MPKRRVLAARITACGIAILALGGMRAEAAQEAIRIGLPAHLTGSMASLDQAVVEGAKLKLAELNAKGGVLGRPLALEIVDTRSDPALVAPAAERMIGQDEVAAIMAYSDTDSALLLGPVAEKGGIPYVTPGATSPKLPGQVGRFMFLACFGDNVQAAAGASFMLRKLKARTVYLLADDSTEYTRLLAGYFGQAYRTGGGRLLGEASYKGGTRDFGPSIAALRALPRQPAALYVAAMPEDIGALVKAMREAGVTLPIVGGDGYDTPLLLETAGAAADGVYFSTHAFMGAQGTAPVRAFIAAYRKAYGHAPENAFSALGYDTLGLIAAAIQRAHSAAPSKIRDALAHTTAYKGVTGTIHYHGDARVPDKTVSMVGIKAGKLFLAEQILPTRVPAP